ncbi:MAG: AraC family transcriptional regulator ligand-binding domain-containing protein [Myxococcales bacterium]
MAPVSASTPCYSARLLFPFASVLKERGVMLPLAAGAIDALDPDLRVPIQVAEGYLVSAIQLSGDHALGLAAGRIMTTGDCPAIDYAVSSAANVREAVSVATRHARLANDALTIALETEGSRAALRMHSSLPLHRASSDFMMASFYACHVVHWPHPTGSVRCSFAHAAPVDRSAYERTFPGVELVFDAANFSFEFDAAVLDMPLHSADPRLHAMAKKYADFALADLPSPQIHRVEVKKLLPAELAQGRTEARNIARKLKVSVRTLGRRLEHEGTTYKALLEEVRQELAMSHLLRLDVSIPEIAGLLGFSDVTAFHRAFKRWTGQTPGAYRARRAPRLASLLVSSR